METLEDFVVGEVGKVFSTQPQVAIGKDGKTYYVKGRNSPILFSEITGCLLAGAAGLKVPHATIGLFGTDIYAAVETVPAANRNIRPWLADLTRINNREALFEVIAVDTWLGNEDRNMGNLVGSSLGDGRIDIFMIDFEKSRRSLQTPL